MNAMRDAYDAVCCYTLSHGGAAFIHQHVVDAFAAQDSSAGDKPIRLTFALVGLYLHVEKRFTGRQVQLAHMKLGRKKRKWPTFQIPDHRGDITAATVLAASPGQQRDAMIDEWCNSVWHAFSNNRESIEELLKQNEICDPSTPKRRAPQ